MSEPSASPTDPRVEELVIEDVGTLKVLADPMRLRIHNELDDPRTVKELAAIFGVPQTRLYYHVKLLERAGLIQVVDRRVVSGIEERTYQVTAISTTVSPALGAELAGSGAVKAMFDMVAAQMEVALQDPLPIGDPSSSVIALNIGKLRMTQDQVAEFQQRLFDLSREYSAPSEDGADYEILLAAYRKGRFRTDAP